MNPGVIAAQMEGGIDFGLGAALHGAITLKDGKVEQANLDSYRVLRIAGVTRIGPAVANAALAATGKRYRVLPISASG